jgi:hypothetical protein
MAREISGKVSLESDLFFVGSTRTDSADSMVTDSAAGKQHFSKMEKLELLILPVLKQIIF